MTQPIPPFSPLARQIMQQLAPNETRAIGGWVRSWVKAQTDDRELRQLARVECDLATTATPDVMRQCFAQHNVHVTDAGLRWGTLTVHPEKTEPEADTVPDLPVEVTTLRQDVYLAGSRYPSVSWTTDWAVDALRRDFTFNAISLSLDGTLYDPFNGAEDLAAGKVVFIGDPQQRLSEDPLRWLRFWRFCATYGTAGITPEVLHIMVQAAPAISTLSRARVIEEWQRLQRGVWAGSVLEVLRHNNLMAHISERLEIGNNV